MLFQLSGISNLPSGVKIQGGQSLQSSASLVNKSAALVDTTVGQSGFSEISGVEELQSTVKSETFGGCMKESSSIFEDFGGLSSKNGGDFSENPCVLSPDNVGDILLGVDGKCSRSGVYTRIFPMAMGGGICHKHQFSNRKKSSVLFCFKGFFHILLNYKA